MAERFLRALDSAALTFCFQTFRDAGMDKSLARTLNGSLHALQQELVQLNTRGAGVFVAVNEIAAGKPRRAEHVVRVRALFADAEIRPN